MTTTDTTTELPRLLKAAEVCEQTGLSRARLYEITRAGAIPHVRIGRAVRYSASAIMDWIRAGGTGPYSSTEPISE